MNNRFESNNQSLGETPFTNERLKAKHNKLFHLTIDAEKLKKSEDSTLIEEFLEKNKDVLDEKPVYFALESDKESNISLDVSVKHILPKSFFAHPTQWIELLPSIDRGTDQIIGSSAESIKDVLLADSYDESKVKIWEDNKGGTKKKIIFKRIEIDEPNEIQRAKKAYSAGIPTPKVLGEIRHNGNTYALFEFIPAISVYDAQFKIFGEKAELKLWNLGAIPISGYRELIQQRLEEFLPNNPQQLNKIILYINEHFHHLAALEVFLKCTNNQYTIVDIENYFQTQRVEEDQIFPIGEYSSIRELIDFGQQMTGDNRNLLKEHNKLRQDLQERVKKVRNTVRGMITNALFGLDLWGEIDNLKSQCSELNISHKDFNYRNLLLPWDFDQDIPLQSEELKKLYIIDWEEN